MLFLLMSSQWYELFFADVVNKDQYGWHDEQKKNKTKTKIKQKKAGM